MLELYLNLQAVQPENISLDYIEKAIILNSFVMDEESPSLSFDVDDDGYIDVVPTEQAGVYCGFFLDKPFGKAGLPRGMRNMLIENEADFSDYKNLLLEEFEDVEFKIDEAYVALKEYEDDVSFSLSDSNFSLLEEEED